MDDDTTRTLSQMVDDAEQVMSDFALALGALLFEASEQTDLEDWVLTSLPLHPNTARRLRAMYVLHSKGRGDVEPWKALADYG